MINIQWTKFERKSIATFISEELPQQKHTNVAFKIDLTWETDYKTGLKQGTENHRFWSEIG